MDSAMTNYLDGLEELKKDPNRKGEVERRRELAREEAFRLMRRLGFWDSPGMQVTDDLDDNAT